MNWMLFDLRPGLLVSRIVAAALTVGAVGGAATIMFIAVYADVGATPAGLVLAVAVPAVLLALTAWQVAAESGRVTRAPHRRRLAWTVSASVLLVMAAQLGPRTSDVDWNDFTETPSMALLGAIVGVVAAGAALLVLLPLVLLLRLVRPRTGLLFAQLSMTVVATAGTAGCVGAVAVDIPGCGPVVGLAASVSGIVAAVIARPVLSAPHVPATAAGARS
ncbi:MULTISPECIES: hypothetical protein [Catenuloplanes]|uniref:Uncharacterized protein n=1 Tax=Catenuloplanes niger TaxID=587534 RepID=A0AAE3ZTU9_9ACTN|nr:hypothetical protein [Catenuloplanes niger]MDR7325969.1 hypothetical protein [Catenuloplanes niger]